MKEEVLNLLADAWNKFTELESQHPNKKNDFMDGIHKCQKTK